MRIQDIDEEGEYYVNGRVNFNEIKTKNHFATGLIHEIMHPFTPDVLITAVSSPDYGTWTDHEVLYGGLIDGMRDEIFGTDFNWNFTAPSIPDTLPAGGGGDTGGGGTGGGGHGGGPWTPPMPEGRAQTDSDDLSVTLHDPMSSYASYAAADYFIA